MAPVIDTIPTSSSTYALMSASTISSMTDFTSLTLGRSVNAIGLLVPPAPAVHTTHDLKARCFDFLANFLFKHSILYSSAGLIAALGHIPGSSYNAALEATDSFHSICTSFFLIDNLATLSFCNHLGAPITTAITTDPSTHPDGVSYFAFHSNVDPVLIDSRLSLLPVYSFEFWLALPQTSLTPLSASTPITNSISKVLNFATPTPTLQEPFHAQTASKQV
jgi:hypothetical protein